MLHGDNERRHSYNQTKCSGLLILIFLIIHVALMRASFPQSNQWMRSKMRLFWERFLGGSQDAMLIHEEWVLCSASESRPAADLVVPFLLIWSTLDCDFVLLKLLVWCFIMFLERWNLSSLLSVKASFISISLYTGVRLTIVFNTSSTLLTPSCFYIN